MADPRPDPEGKVIKNDDLQGKVVDTFDSVIPSGKGRAVLNARLINFKIDSRKLKTPHANFLEKEVVPLLRENGHFVCELHGEATNDKAGAVHNGKLADQRANEVASFLLRHGASREQVAIDTGLVVGEFGNQRGEDRAVSLEVLDPVGTEFTIRLEEPAALWRSISGEIAVPPFDLAFRIEDIKNDLATFYFFAANDVEAMSRVSIGTPLPGHPGFGISGIINTAEFVSTKDFTSALSQIFNPNDASAPNRPGFARFIRVALASPEIGSTSTQVSVSHAEWGAFTNVLQGRLVFAMGVAQVRSTPTSAIRPSGAQQAQTLAALRARPRRKTMNRPAVRNMFGSLSRRMAVRV